MIGEGNRVRLSQRGIDTLAERDNLLGNLFSEGVVVEDRFVGQVGVEFDNLRWEHMVAQDENIIYLWRDDLEVVEEPAKAKTMEEAWAEFIGGLPDVQDERGRAIAHSLLTVGFKAGWEARGA